MEIYRPKDEQAIFTKQHEIKVNNMKMVKLVVSVIFYSMDEKKQIFAKSMGYGEFKSQW